MSTVTEKKKTETYVERCASPSSGFSQVRAESEPMVCARAEDVRQRVDRSRCVLRRKGGKTKDGGTGRESGRTWATPFIKGPGTLPRRTA